MKVNIEYCDMEDFNYDQKLKKRGANSYDFEEWLRGIWKYGSKREVCVEVLWEKWHEHINKEEL